MPVPDLAQLKGTLPRMAVLTAIWAGLVGLLVAVGEIIVGSAAITGFDHRVTHAVASSRTGALNSVMGTVTWFGSWVALVVAAAVIALLVARKRLPVLAAVVAVFAWAGEALGVRIAKEVVTRGRPPQDIWVAPARGWSFPSGHAATASLAFTALALCAAVLTRRRLVRTLTWVTGVLAVAGTALSRVELGVHWTTDVTASIVFVACWLTATWIALGGLLRQAGRDLGKEVTADSGEPVISPVAADPGSP